MFKRLLLGSAGVIFASGMVVTTASAELIDDFIDAPQAISISGPRDGAPCVASVTNTCTLGNDSAIPGSVVAPVSVTVLDNDGGDVVGDAGPHASIIGGYRDITTTLVQSPGASRTTDSEAALIGGEFSHSQETGVYSNSYITWDGFDGEGLNADLTDGGNSNYFHLVVNSADDGVVWSLELFDSVGSDIFTFANEGVIAVPTDLYLSFANWSVDFTDIQKIVFGANIESAVDFDTAVALVETVGIPEPASMTLLGAGLMGLAGFSRRRKIA